MPSQRTILDFQTDRGDAPRVIEAWAKSWHYQLERIDPDGTEHYWSDHRWSGYWLPGMDTTHMSIRVASGDVHLEVWKTYGRTRRLLSAGIVSGPMGIESGGLRDSGGRGLSRKQVNALLESLHGPAIR